jgi:uncharacterized protein (DUF362 family)/Pyruvate/2-oxoacid:ferredoxin oxidoreductase delta subunit
VAIVAVRPCIDYDAEKVYTAVLRAVAAAGFTVPSGKRVLIKPNILGQNKPDQAVTTHPAVVGAVCRIFSEKGCECTIGESSAFYQGGGTEEGFVTSGISEIAKKYGAKLLPFESSRLVKIDSGRALTPFYITDAVFSHDLVVDLPKLKLHRLARYTGAIKNLYGCIPGGTKQLYHMRYQERPDYQEYWGKPLVDVYQAVNPDLTVMDAVVGLDKDGPAANGTPRPTGVILASQNGAALDIAACRIIGFDPLWVPAIAEAVRRGIADPLTVKIDGELPSVPYDRLPDLVKKTGLSKKVDDYMFAQLIVEPRISRAACSGCGLCIDGCASGAVTAGGNGFPVIDYSRCIRCYCCKSLCPNAAISLHGGGVNHIIRALRVMTGI